MVNQTSIIPLHYSDNKGRMPKSSTKANDLEDDKYKLKNFGLRMLYYKFSRSIVLIIVGIFLTYMFLSYDYGQDDEMQQKGEIYLNISKPSGIKRKEEIRKSNLKVDSEKADAIVRAFRHCWKGYKKYAFGADNFHPLSKSKSEWFGLGLTMTDSIDTAFIMKQYDIVDDSYHYIKNYLSFKKEGSSNLFELTIRIIGGFLSMYHLSNDNLYLEKATYLADLLLPCFDTRSGIPKTSFDFSLNLPIEDYQGASTAEFTTLQLEWKYLSVLNNDTKYWRAVEKPMRVIRKAEEKLDGLVPIFTNIHTGHFIGANIRLGSRGDSYYEYLWKQFIQFQGKESVYKSMFEESIDGVLKNLLRYSNPNHLAFIAELPSGRNGNISPKMDHLVCFLPGTMVLYASSGKLMSPEDINNMHPKARVYFSIAQELAYTCYKMYKDMATGLSPEIAYFNLNNDKANDITVQIGDSHNLLRPETVESLFYLYRATRNYPQKNIECRC